MTTPSQERATRIAYNLMRLGVSHQGVQRLLNEYPYELVEKQLAYLPFRKARRPEAMIIQSIRRNYTAPKEFFYATHQTNPSSAHRPVDQGAERALGPHHAEDQGHGAPGTPGDPQTDLRLEPGGEDSDPPVQDPDEADW